MRLREERRQPRLQLHVHHDPVVQGARVGVPRLGYKKIGGHFILRVRFLELVMQQMSHIYDCLESLTWDGTVSSKWHDTIQLHACMDLLPTEGHDTTSVRYSLPTKVGGSLELRRRPIRRSRYQVYSSSSPDQTEFNRCRTHSCLLIPCGIVMVFDRRTFLVVDLVR
ncbi:hypothetical protein BDN67DRAFT_324045 [Paxillus ammoniavirescens]|nr:hypothetical protein BDN67DRAFT_324045 [Paxillus ammoniavirescens]